MAQLNRGELRQTTSFQLQTGDAGGFSNRMNSVFDSLNGLEAKHKAWEREHEGSASAASLLKDDPEAPEEITKRSDGPAAFKRPWSNACAPRKRKPPPFGVGGGTPDFKLHPEKWTKYSLEDVSEDDMSEATNKAAALEYLRERRSQSGDDADMDQADGGQARHVFHRRSKDEVDVDTGVKQLISRPGKIVMPECVVGAKAPGRKPSVHKIGAQSVMAASSALSFHYDDDDDDEDGDDDHDAVRSEELGGMQPAPVEKHTAKSKPRSLRARTEDD